MNTALKGFSFLIIFMLFNCHSKIAKPEPECDWKTIKVTATAYNSVPYQTQGNSHITAFGDTLKPNLKSIAVSRDLLNLGLTHNTKVAIEGFQGLFTVNDKMHGRWKNRIDIYMGEDINAAKNWGRKKITIAYCIKPLKIESSTKDNSE